MTDLEKQNAINELTNKIKDDKFVSEAIKEIAEKLGMEEDFLLSTFVHLEVEKELKSKAVKS